jgi:hypothetical protein
MTTITGSIVQGAAAASRSVRAGLTAIFNGSLRVKQQILSETEVTAKTINLTTHVHEGVQTGGGNTGAPK